MSELKDFLLARIEEDEERAGSGWSRHGDTRWERTNEGQSILTPGAVLAECEAKRRIIAEFEDAVIYVRENLHRILAHPYRDHPDFRPEWRL